MIYLIKNKDTHWGDWSDLLWSGFAPYDDETDVVYIERTGPFVPPVYISGGNLIFTETAKESYEKHFIDSLIFPYILEKRKIVNIDWQKWDKNKEFYDYIEDVFEPEDIIENYLHDNETALAMENLYLAETINSIHLGIDKNSKSKNPSDYIFLKNPQEERIDFAEGIEYRGYFISERVKNWFDDNFPECFEMYLINEN